MSAPSALRSSSSRSIRSTRLRNRSAAMPPASVTLLAVNRFRRQSPPPFLFWKAGGDSGPAEPRSMTGMRFRPRRPSAPGSPLSGISPAIPCRACRRRSPAPPDRSGRSPLVSAAPSRYQRRQAVPAEPRQVHHVDVLHVGARRAGARPACGRRRLPAAVRVASSRSGAAMVVVLRSCASIWGGPGVMRAKAGPCGVSPGRGPRDRPASTGGPPCRPPDSTSPPCARRWNAATRRRSPRSMPRMRR